MYKSINVRSRYDMVDYTYVCDRPCVIVSISGRTTPAPVFCDNNENVKDVLFLSFSDTEHDPDCIQKEDAQKIVDFLDKHREDDVDLFFHCRAGISRSAGCAAAAMLMEYGDDSEIFDSGRYRPNMKCYRRVLDAAGITFDDIKAAEEAKRKYDIEQLNKKDEEEFMNSLKDFEEVHFHNIVREKVNVIDDVEDDNQFSLGE